MSLGLAMNDLFDTVAEATSVKERTDKLDFIKIRKYLTCNKTLLDNEKANQRQLENLCKRHT